MKIVTLAAAAVAGAVLAATVVSPASAVALNGRYRVPRDGRSQNQTVYVKDTFGYVSPLKVGKPYLTLHVDSKVPVLVPPNKCVVVWSSGSYTRRTPVNSAAVRRWYRIKRHVAAGSRLEVLDRRTCDEWEMEVV